MQPHATFIRRSRCIVAVCALLVSAATWGDALTDPTRPPVVAIDRSETVSAPAIATAPFKLEGIVRQGGRLVAIVDGQLVRAGSWIGDARIDEVGTDAVHYTRAGQSRVARFETAPVRVRRTATTP